MQLRFLLKKEPMSMQKITPAAEFYFNTFFFYETPLHYACKNGFIEAVNILIEKGADVNAVTPTVSFFIKSFPYLGLNKISFGLHLE